MHVWGVVANFWVIPQGFGDVRGVYPYWLQLAASGDVVGVTEPWVYPLLAWLPILASSVFGVDQVPFGWTIVVAVVNAGALAALLTLRRGVAMGAVWLLCLGLLAPVSLSRIDTISVPLVLIAIVLIRHARVGFGAALVTAAAWIKVWPGVVYLAMLAIRRGERLRILAAGAITSSAVLLIGLALGSGSNVLSFMFEQGERGLQIESVPATWLMWRAADGAATVYYDRDILTYQVVGDGATWLINATTPLLIALTAVIVAVAVLVSRHTDQALLRQQMALTVLALVAVLIVTNKVGSPQFVTWLAVPAVLLAEQGLRKYAGLIAAIAAISLLTNLVYPWMYGEIVGTTPFGLVLLTVRNACEVALLAVAVFLLARSRQLRWRVQ